MTTGVLHSRGRRQACRFLFVVGTGRCGSTLMAQVLNAHSKICVPHELQIVFEYSNNGPRLAEAFARWNHLTYRAQDYIDLIASRCPHRFETYYDYPGFFRSLRYPVLSLRWLLTTLYTDIARSQSKSLFGEQTPWYGQNIPLLNRLFPQARFIHIVRDGRDVAISYARTPWWHRDATLNLERWQAEVNQIQRDASRLLDGRMLTIRYEDLIASPEDVVRRTSQFLDVDFEPGMLDAENHVDYRQYSKQYKPTTMSNAYLEWDQEKKSPFFSGSVYAWKQNHEVQFRQISPAVSETLAKFGYEVP